MEQSNKFDSMRNDFIMFLQNMKEGNLCIAEKVLSDLDANDLSNSIYQLQNKNTLCNQVYDEAKFSRNVRFYLYYLLMNERDETKSNNLMELQNEINKLLNLNNPGFNNQDIN